MRVTATLDELKAALLDRNVQAWMRVIREGESSPDTDEAYVALFGWSRKSGGPTFNDFSTHPRIAAMSKWGWTSAAGAYQAMATVPGKVKTDTWDNARDWFSTRGYQLTMRPDDQDLFAVWCTARRGALQAVIAGQIVLAMSMCNEEWASLPASPYGQPTVSAERLLAVYARFGGTLNAPAAGAPTEVAEPAEPAAPIVSMPAGEAPDWQPPAARTEPPKEAGMAFPIIPAIAQFLIGAAAEQIPRLTQIFKPSSPVAERNVALATMALDVVQKAVGASNAQEAVERIKSDPAALQLARDAVDANWYRLQEAHEASIGKAREFARAAPERIVIWNMVFHEVLALLMVLISAGGAAAVLAGDFSNELKIAVVTLMIVGGYTGIKEFFFGGSRGSDNKNAALIERGRS